jgi:hypothetical protein
MGRGRRLSKLATNWRVVGQRLSLSLRDNLAMGSSGPADVGHLHAWAPLSERTANGQLTNTAKQAQSGPLDGRSERSKFLRKPHEDNR